MDLPIIARCFGTAPSTGASVGAPTSSGLIFGTPSAANPGGAAAGCTAGCAILPAGFEEAAAGGSSLGGCAGTLAPAAALPNVCHGTQGCFDFTAVGRRRCSDTIGPWPAAPMGAGGDVAGGCTLRAGTDIVCGTS